MNIKEIFNKYNCDKGSNVDNEHHYYNIYSILFECIRNNQIKILEFGIANGDSIKSWLDYFSNCTIYAVDNNLSRIIYPDLKNNPRVNLIEKNCPCLVTNESEFNIIIDDLDHCIDTQCELIKIHWDKLKIGGFYIIEDLFVGDKNNLFKSKRVSKSSNHLIPKYNGYSCGGNEYYYPKHVQDLIFLNRNGLESEIINILDNNFYTFTITNISEDGGLHVVLVIQKIKK